MCVIYCKYFVLHSWIELQFLMFLKFTKGGGYTKASYASNLVLPLAARYGEAEGNINWSCTCYLFY